MGIKINPRRFTIKLVMPTSPTRCANSLYSGMLFPYTLFNLLVDNIVITKPDGTAPQIGDNDDGRLHILSDYGNWSRLDHRYLLSVGAVMFERGEFKAAAGVFPEEAFWLVGAEGLNIYKVL